MSSPISFGQVAQLVKKFEQVGWDAKRISQLGQANDGQFRAIERILDSERKSDNISLRFSQTTTIAPTKGDVTIASASDVFTGSIDSRFKKWRMKVDGIDAPKTSVNIYEATQDGTFSSFFTSLGAELSSLCLTQGQIVEFCRSSRHMLRKYLYGTFFLFKVDGSFFVARVVDCEGPINVYDHRFDYDGIWPKVTCSRIVVPQQAV